MRIYLLTEDDFRRLLAEIDRDPAYGDEGGSSVVLSATEKEAHQEAHRHFNYRIRRWIDTVQRER